jgi:hypothetical protein
MLVPPSITFLAKELQSIVCMNLFLFNGNKNEEENSGMFNGGGKEKKDIFVYQ